MDAFVEVHDAGALKDPAALEADIDLGTCTRCSFKQM